MALSRPMKSSVGLAVDLLELDEFQVEGGVGETRAEKN